MLQLDLLPAFTRIPAGAFLLGTPERDLSALAKAYGGTRESYREESPQHTLMLSAFEIARIPVTNALYAAFVAATGAHAPSTWRAQQPSAALADHPVVDVSWDEANAFCGWLTTATKDEGRRMKDEEIKDVLLGHSSSVFRLPTEAEWERAARGIDGRAFPWAAAWDTTCANTRESGLAFTTPAGAYPSGASADACLDMAGNVWEWTASLDLLYPYAADDGREDPRAAGRRILRGGCYANPHGFARCACRFRLLPTVRNPFMGFRLARNV
ncbi:MAG: formylglycine-generating enzyme family protein [Roseiflexaceae bacterium]